MVDISYKKHLESMKATLNQRKGQEAQLVQERDNLDVKLNNTGQKLLRLQESQILLQRVSDVARAYGKQRLEKVVTSALQFVFGPEVSFEIELTEVAGRPNAEFYLVTDNNGVKSRTKPVDSNGGGVVDIIALALRVAVLQIHHEPVVSGPIILDEPGKHVSEEYAERMATFLQQMSSYFNRQVIMVTHQPYLAEIADKAFEVQIINGESKVKEV